MKMIFSISLSLSSLVSFLFLFIKKKQKYEKWQNSKRCCIKDVKWYTCYRFQCFTSIFFFRDCMKNCWVLVWFLSSKSISQSNDPGKKMVNFILIQALKIQTTKIWCEILAHMAQNSRPNISDRLDFGWISVRDSIVSSFNNIGDFFSAIYWNLIDRCYYFRCYI